MPARRVYREQTSRRPSSLFRLLYVTLERDVSEAGAWSDIQQKRETYSSQCRRCKTSRISHAPAPRSRPAATTGVSRGRAETFSRQGCLLITGTALLAGCDGFFISSHTTTTLTTSTAAVTTGTSVILTAKVVTTAATGTVTFFNGSTQLGTGTLASGVATYTAQSLPAGTDSLTAVYGGDSTYSASTSAPVVVTVTSAAPAITTTTLTASSNSLPSGMSVVLKATVSPTAATGTVTFYNGSTNLGTDTLASGVATLTVTALPVGIDSLTAAYAGDTSNAASTSTAITVTIT